MKRLSMAVVIALVVVGLVACASVGEGEVTREVVVDGGGERETAVPPTTVPNTPTPTAMPAPSRIPASTDVPLPTLFATVTRTPEPTITPWPSATPRPTIDFNQELVWTENVIEINRVGGNSIVWSPVTNEFILDYCPDPDDPTPSPDQIVFIVSSPDFEPQNITPPDLDCIQFTNFIWHPTGQQIVYNGISTPNYFYPTVTDIRIMDRNGRNGRSFDKKVDKNLELVGWINNSAFVYYDYISGGQYIVTMLDIETGEVLAWDRIHAGIAYALTENYVVVNNGAYTDSWYSVETFSIKAVREGDEISPYSRSLSIVYDTTPYQLLFNSRYETTLPNSNQVLVLTWDADSELDDNVLTGSTNTDLQLWNLDTNELDLIIPGGIYGRYSPNGRFLAYLTPSEQYPQIHLLDQNSGNHLFDQSAYAEANIFDIENFLDAFVTFSPNGRFLTFFNPAHELIIYDLENGEFLAPVTAVPATPLWSPDGSRFVYQDPVAGLSIFDTRNQNAYPLAISGGDRLLDPQWSFDGTYLSVTVLQEEWWERETAVLQIP